MAENAVQREEQALPNLEEIQRQVMELQARLDTMDKNAQEDKLTMVCFSGELDKTMAAFIIAIGAVAMDMEAVMFFTFWGTPVLRSKEKSVSGKDFMGKMFGSMLPTGPSQLKLSKMNMGGMGTAMLKSLMAKKKVASLEELIQTAGELGVKIVICEMTMNLMGFKHEEMIDYPHLSYGGVAKFLGDADKSRVQLFL